jgi:CHAT domain-containing protein
VLTHDGRVGLGELERLLAPSRFRDEPVELIALSACETAAGDDRTALGLAGVAVKAGARSALATLWQVSDEATALAAAEFYRQLGTADRVRLAVEAPREPDPFDEFLDAADPVNRFFGR